MPRLILPPWDLDFLTYSLLCRYLRLSPSEELFKKLRLYLAKISWREVPVRGFNLWLAERLLGLWALGFVDVWTRLLFRSNPWRFKLNAIIAIHECNGKGYAELSHGHGGPIWAWIGILGSGLAYSVNLILGGCWLVIQGLMYQFTRLVYPSLEKRFVEKTVLLTGVSRGLGFSLMLHLLAKGARVVGIVRNREGLRILREQFEGYGTGLEDRLVTVPADVSEPGAVASALKTAGISLEDIDIVVANAGIKIRSHEIFDLGAIQKTFETNFFGALETVKGVIPAMIQRGSGHIVFISSIGRWHGMKGTSGYNSSKAALSIMAESLRMDLCSQGKEGVKITVVEPGLINTDMVNLSGSRKLFSVDRNRAAMFILAGIAKDKPNIVFPKGFAIMTKTLSIIPANIRAELLGKVV
jgi:NAD(P)-dependent dehydrogenase (short-subunit alcohol dehydrogenase family)